MEVIGHEAVREACELVPADDPIQAIQEVGAVGIEPKDRSAIATARVDVVRNAWSE
jgi:hypothetical protein